MSQSIVERAKLYIAAIAKLKLSFPGEENSFAQAVLDMSEALEWYQNEGNYLSDDAGCVIATAWQRNMLGYKARAVLQKWKVIE